MKNNLKAALLAAMVCAASGVNAQSKGAVESFTTSNGKRIVVVDSLGITSVNVYDNNSGALNKVSETVFSAGQEVTNLFALSPLMTGKTDGMPRSARPFLVSPAQNYEHYKPETFAVYSGFSAIKQPKLPFKLWRTENATYFAIAYEMQWDRQYFYEQSEMYIKDVDTGVEYKVRGHMGLPVGQMYKVDGQEGKHIVFVYEFPPLPKKTKRISFYERRDKVTRYEESHKHDFNWGTTGIRSIKVKKLEKNKDFDYPYTLVRGSR